MVSKISRKEVIYPLLKALAYNFSEWERKNLSWKFDSFAILRLDFCTTLLNLADIIVLGMIELKL